MSADVSLLLPSNSSTFERILAAAASEALPVEIRAILNAATTPARFLPFLAGHESVDLWFSDWSGPRKRAMIAEAMRLAWLKGTRQGTVRFLSYVDAELLDVVAYPARFVLGRARVGRTPIGHPPFVARHLVKVVTAKPPNAKVMGRGVIGRSVLKTPSRDPFRRVFTAMRASKAPETEYRADFAHKRVVTFGDAPLFDGATRFGSFVDRNLL